MARGRAAALVLALLCGAGSAWAQEAPAEGVGAPQLNVDRLPLDLRRIQRGLKESTARREGEGLNLRFQVEVFGSAPPIQLFTSEDNLATGPVPYGAPTHKQMLEVMTPQEFRAPVMDFNALFRWLAEKAR